MWLLAMFDLPVETKTQRRIATNFRKGLLKDGFTMLQLSVYARYCANENASEAHRKRIKAGIPDEGFVRVVSLTDIQFAKMGNYVGKKRKDPEPVPAQLEFF